jgi:hypothetical protein
MVANNSTYKGREYLNKVYKQQIFIYNKVYSNKFYS